ncbi:hypothetical protein [Sandarakinorhabdus oryzae]|uniref:hypothetical protein n=1 Tax=Sandarakinorhabdus oryzae TaxID=2675220 RepID=UPI0012E1646B|nr:hypothetical protein [Sandarakinorhabdus oryzae]
MRSILWLSLTAVLFAGAADAAPRKGKRPVKRPTAKAVVKPVAPKAPITPGIMVPKAVVLTKPTPAEARAHAVWTLRAALNVAALQCQYSPFLRAVDNYNQMLKKHGDDLASAQAMMISHFVRTVKSGGMAAFDRYNTRSYNSFSTLDAQYNFCWAAGQAGLALRAAAPGEMARVAETAVVALRDALGIVPPAAGLMVPPMATLPDFRLPIYVADD